MRHVTLISTGGTIEKTYDERTGALENRHSVVHTMLAQLRLEDVAINTVQLLQKDSQHFTDHDRKRIIDLVRIVAPSTEQTEDTDADTQDNQSTDGIVILHGTDTLHLTGDRLHAELTPTLKVPVILTGAMRPFEMKSSDALQNLNEAIFATGVLPPGVWCVAHSRAMPFPGVTKNIERGTFVKDAQ